jgi:hypothetical protein
VHAGVANCGTGISRGGEGAHQLERSVRVERVLGGNSPPPDHCTRAIAGCLAFRRDRLHGALVPARVCGARCVQPLGEFRRRARHVKAGQQIATIQFDRIHVATRIHRLVERDRVAPERAQIQPYFVGGTTDDGIGAECVTEKEDRLAERVTSVRLVLVGPEEYEQSIAAMRTSGSREREISEQGDAPGLREDGAQLATVGRLETKRPERAEP